MSPVDIVKQSLWEQFSASIEMLKNGIVMWPDDRWETKPKAFRMAYHTIYFLDYYLTNPPRAIVSDDDSLPERILSKKELLEYLEACRDKCKEVIDSFDENNLERRWTQSSRWAKSFNYFELMMYNMRHVQHHAAQLNMMLRNEINDSPDWISRHSEPGL